MMGDTDVVDTELDLESNSTDYKGDYHYYYKPSDDIEESHQLPEEARTKPTPTVFFGTIPDISTLNNEKISSYYPIFIFLGIVLILGFLCNFVVCYIYRCRSRRATSNFFVIFFAIADLVCCILGISAELIDLLLPYTYKVKTLCQFTAFLKSLLVCQLPLTLMCVGYDCYKKVCRRNDEFSVKKAGFYCGVSILLAILLSIPAYTVHGIKQILTEHEDVVGTTCAPDPNMPEWLNILHHICLLFPFTLSFITMIIFYSLIAVSHLREKQAEERGEKPSPVKRAFPKIHTFVSKEDINSSSTSYFDEMRWQPSQTSTSHSAKPIYNDPARVPLKAGTGVTVKKTNSMQVASNSGNVPVIPLQLKNNRQAFMFALISILFVIFMLPFVVVEILGVATREFDTPRAYDTDLTYNFCVRSYLLNYLTKPAVYLILNMNFRKEVKHLFNKMLVLCLRNSPNDSSTSLPQPQPQAQRAAPQSLPRNLLKRQDQRKAERSPMLHRAGDSQTSSSHSVQKPRERWRWNQSVNE